MISKIKLVVIFEGCLHHRVLLLSFVKALKNPCLESMEEVDQPKPIRNESQLDDELNVKQLLSQKVTAE